MTFEQPHDTQTQRSLPCAGGTYAPKDLMARPQHQNQHKVKIELQTVEAEVDLHE